MTQIPCKYCDDHPQVLYDRDAPEGKKVTNLDGTYHRHNKGQQQSSSPQRNETSVAFKDNEELAKYTYAARQEAIEQSHKENMDASESLRKSIDSLAIFVERVAIALEKQTENQAQAGGEF